MREQLSFAIDDEAHGRGCAAADVQRGGGLGAFDLVPSGCTRDVIVAVQHHTYAGRADRMT